MAIAVWLPVLLVVGAFLADLGAFGMEAPDIDPCGDPIPPDTPPVDAINAAKAGTIVAIAGLAAAGLAIGWLVAGRAEGWRRAVLINTVVIVLGALALLLAMHKQAALESFVGPYEPRCNYGG